MRPSEGYAWYRQCPICGNETPDVIYENQLSKVDGLDMSYAVSYCHRCVFSYASALPTAADYDTYYRELSKYDVSSDTSEVSDVDRYRADKSVSFCMPFLTQDAHIADLGCGSGVLLNAFKQAGWQVLHGLDPAPNAARNAQQLFALDNVQTGTLAQAAKTLKLSDMDLVCMMGVLEHLPNLRADLVAITQHLSAQSLLLIEVPAEERFIKDEFEPYGEFSLEHIQYFSAASLTRLMQSLGLHPIQVAYLPLPKGSTDSVIGLFGWQDNQYQFVAEPSGMHDYIAESERLLELALNTISNCDAEQFIIYGAGSHTARLLPKMADLGLQEKIVFLVDGNTNLQGKTMDGLAIHSPESLASNAAATVIVSSFRSQNAIAKMLAEQYKNPIMKLY